MEEDLEEKVQVEDVFRQISTAPHVIICHVTSRMSAMLSESVSFLVENVP